MRSGTEPGLILIIKPSGPARDLLEVTLRREGFAVTCATDGGVALDYLRGNPLPQLILLDLSQPSLDGLGTLNRLKENGCLRHIPVAVLTGPEQASDQSLAWMIGADFRLHEPVSVTL